MDVLKIIEKKNDGAITISVETMDIFVFLTGYLT